MYRQICLALLVVSAVNSFQYGITLFESRSEITTCNVTQFGAVGNGKVLNTVFIQAAIDACARYKNSVVYFPPGSYLTGTVFLKSNMVLLLDPDAIILGSPEQVDYPFGKSRWYVVFGENVENVGVTGGEINGQSLKFVTKFDQKKNVMVSWNTTNACFGDECRPRLVGFVNSKNIHIWDVSLKQPAYWCLHLVNSDFTYIHDVSIWGDFNTPNNDGIDIDGSNNTIIDNCHIDTGDDAICPKTTYGPLFNLTVTNCWIRTKSCAIKLGSATSYDFSGLLFDNITIVDSHRGLGVQLRDSGNVYNTRFSNIVMSTRYYDPSWWGRAEPIYVTSCPRDSSTKVGAVHDLEFINVRATSESGIFLAGSDGGILRNLKLVNVSVLLERSTEYAAGLQDFRPGCQGLVQHNVSSGMFIKNVKNLLLLNVSVKGINKWDLPMEFGPRSVANVAFQTVNFQK